MRQPQRLDWLAAAIVIMRPLSDAQRRGGGAQQRSRGSSRATGKGKGQRGVRSTSILMRESFSCCCRLNLSASSIRLRTTLFRPSTKCRARLCAAAPCCLLWVAQRDRAALVWNATTRVGASPMASFLAAGARRAAAPIPDVFGTAAIPHCTTHRRSIVQKQNTLPTQPRAACPPRTPAPESRRPLLLPSALRAEG